jgi:hypothetical protein
MVHQRYSTADDLVKLKALLVLGGAMLPQAQPRISPRFGEPHGSPPPQRS